MTFAARTFFDSAATASTLYTGTITCGVFSFSGISYRGLSPGVITGGSASPTTIVSGETVYAVYDYRYPTATPDPEYAAVITLSGFTTNPGASFLSSATVNGVPKSTSIATYSWDNTNSRATWIWDGAVVGVLWGLPTSGTVSASFFG